MKIALKGQQVAVGKTKQNKYTNVVIDGLVTMITFPNSIPVSKGEVLNGNVEIGQKTYDKDADGQPLATPFTRWEVTSYQSTAVRIALKRMEAEERELDNQLMKDFSLTKEDIAALVG